MIISLLIIAFAFPSIFQRFPKTKQGVVLQPVFGEKGYDPEILGYPALIGKAMNVSDDALAFRSSMCLQTEKDCDPIKEYEYRANITNDTILKRLTKKSEEEFAGEIKSQKNPAAPPNPFQEEKLVLANIKVGENVTVLVKEIINDTTVVAHEIRIFEPLEF